MECVTRLGGRAAVPDTVDQLVGRNALADAKREQRQRGTRLRAGDVQLARRPAGPSRGRAVGPRAARPRADRHSSVGSNRGSLRASIDRVGRRWRIRQGGFDAQARCGLACSLRHFVLPVTASADSRSSRRRRFGTVDIPAGVVCPFRCSGRVPVDRELPERAPGQGWQRALDLGGGNNVARITNEANVKVFDANTTGPGKISLADDGSFDDRENGHWLVGYGGLATRRRHRWSSTAVTSCSTWRQTGRSRWSATTDGADRRRARHLPNRTIQVPGTPVPGTCQSSFATTCLICVYSSIEYADMSLP